jgi:hypothetical protein
MGRIVTGQSGLTSEFILLLNTVASSLSVAEETKKDAIKPHKIKN